MGVIMRRRKQQDIDLDLIHGLDAGNYDAAYIGGDWHKSLKKRIKAGQAVTDEYEGAYIIGFLSGDYDPAMFHDEYSDAVVRYGKRLRELGRVVEEPQDVEEPATEEPEEEYETVAAEIRRERREALGTRLSTPRRNPCQENPARRFATVPTIDRRKEREKAEKFWKSLSDAEKWEIGDQLVLGSFDWRDWLNRPPSRVFLNEVDYLRMNWESGRE